MATIRSVMRFEGRAARCSALVLTLAALLGLPSPGGARPVSEAQCIVEDVKCTDKCDSKGTLEKLCYAFCDAKLKACKAEVPSGPPDVRVGGNKALPGNTRFPAGSVPPRANTSVGGNKQTMSGGTTPAGTKGGAAGSVTAVTSNPALNPTLLSTGGAFGATKTGPGVGPIAGGSINGRKPN